MQNSTFQQGNLLAASIRTDMEIVQQHSLQAISETATEPDPPVEASIPNNQAINVISTDNTQMLLLELLCQLNTNMQDINVAHMQNTNGMNMQGTNTLNGTPVRCNTNCWYSWSHSMCGHKSNKCRNKKENIMTTRQKMTG